MIQKVKEMLDRLDFDHEKAPMSSRRYLRNSALKSEILAEIKAASGETQSRMIKLYDMYSIARTGGKTVNWEWLLNPQAPPAPERFDGTIPWDEYIASLKP